MTPQVLLDRLVALFPDFRAFWDDSGNLFLDDSGAFTHHGVFSQFTGFYRERYAMLPSDRVAALGAFVSECMDHADSPLDSAAATCFVENIAGEPCERELSAHLTGEARRYLLAWSSRTKPDIDNM